MAEGWRGGFLGSVFHQTWICLRWKNYLREVYKIMNIEIAAEKIFSVFNFPISNTMLTAWIAMLIVVGFSYFATKHVSLIPSRLQNFFEWIIEELLNTVDGVMGDRKETERFFPLIATIFIFVLSTNWLGLLPGFGSIGFYETFEGSRHFVPFFRSTNADLNTTIALAVISVFSIQTAGIAALGFFGYAKKFISFRSFMGFIVGLLELISEITKLISFSFRLFGSVFAGEVLLIVMAFLIPYILPLPFIALEVFIGFIQAFVFSLLTTVFIKMAMTVSEGH
ncbi:MAG: F0F1 ATP synthase subunit A [Patescibacteria group bacterium]